ncbi:NADH:flavin oxidoreductase [Sorangium cellulosum]|uniref:NADH:flavin oxidoreductase n=1 Tax=Sorangium cellulosum TaxID=56 RepID=A0A150RH07_SORCE|nr:NADH:flavin oxidoreductase [Sorangium cellulosum]
MVSLFEPFRLKDVTLRNRVVVAPMCQYSSRDGYATDWHLVHLGSMARGGAGLAIAEATAVSPEGRISPRDAGLWEDGQIEPLRRITAFLKEQGAVPGIQLAHAGRKASANRPWEGDNHLTKQEGAWEILAPSAKAYGERLTQVPKEMTKADIERVKSSFASAARRASEAGYEWLELHFAHGYLANSFLSPLSNARTDEYGGSFENRSRFLVETLEAVRDAWPERLPLTVRLSVTDWLEGGTTIEDSIELTKRLKSSGLDLLDVSHSFVVPDCTKIPWGPGFLLPYAARIRKEAGVPVGCGWFINSPEQAEAALREGQTDLILLGHPLLDDPHWAYHAAKKLGVQQPTSILPSAYAHWLKQR